MAVAKFIHATAIRVFAFVSVLGGLRGAFFSGILLTGWATNSVQDFLPFDVQPDSLVVACAVAGLYAIFYVVQIVAGIALFLLKAFYFLLLLIALVLETLCILMLFWWTEPLVLGAAAGTSIGLNILLLLCAPFVWSWLKELTRSERN